MNDVAGFIGPEVFRSREQLVRCCLEDIVMGKLHGLCIGLDVCSTLHMDVSLDDLDWCLERIMPVHPAYLMALPTKIDPMLGYLTTGFQDHVRLREQFGRRVNDRMQAFFQSLGVVDDAGQPTQHFGDTAWVYLQYRRRKQDARSDEAILAEAKMQMAAVRRRGLFLVDGHGDRPWRLAPKLEQETQRIYNDAKQSIWAELSPSFVAKIPAGLPLSTRSVGRTQFILHPETGERLDPTSQEQLDRLRREHAGKHDVQIVVSDGLNALSIMDEGQLVPFLEQLRTELHGPRASHRARAFGAELGSRACRLSDRGRLVRQPRRSPGGCACDWRAARQRPSYLLGLHDRRTGFNLGPSGTSRPQHYPSGFGHRRHSIGATHRGARNSPPAGHHAFILEKPS